MANTKRMQQMAEQIREFIATMLIRGDVSDPRIKNVTINSVKMSPDLQLAKIYFTVFGEKSNQLETQKGFKQAAGYIRRELGKTLQIRYIPELAFYYDESVEHSVKIGALLSQVRQELRDTLSSDDEIKKLKKKSL